MWSPQKLLLFTALEPWCRHRGSALHLLADNFPVNKTSIFNVGGGFKGRVSELTPSSPTASLGSSHLPPRVGPLHPSRIQQLRHAESKIL